ncbi:MAG TPA: MarR family transcriptional regulator [Acidimicrobiales bacterium]|jgi:DNA-binding MarR family transcriptional regulator|nr:MarR family transcriptional regulator [Acidimicrobiales bacterium]
MARSPLDFDPIEEARTQWAARWEPDVSDAMAAATSIMRAQQVVLAAVDGVLRPFGLTFARYEGLVLLLYSRQGVLPLGKMGQRLMIHPTSVTNIVDRLEQQGLVRRLPHPTDGRTTLAEITRDGRALATRATVAVNEASFGLGELSADDLQQLMRIIRKLRCSVGDFAE